jgi:integrase/recombinase XerD
MLENYFDSPVRIRALRDNSVGASFESFAQELSEADYAPSSVRGHIWSAEQFTYWAGRQSIPLARFDDAVVERFNRYLTHSRSPLHHHSNRVRIVHGARMFLSHLRSKGVVATATIEPADPALLVAFRRWMHQQRGTYNYTLESYSRPIRDLLKRIGEDPEQLNAQSLRQFFLKRCQRQGVPTVQMCATALRMFCRFLSAEERCSRDLAAAIPTIAHWRLSSLPRYLTAQDVECVIAACNSVSSTGRRDRAILLLLARLGLRAGDVVQLRLADINWQEAWIQVSGKSRRYMQLPLTQEVGDAIASYIRDGRPETGATAVFVRSRAPYRALGPHSTISKIVAAALQRANVRRPSRGAAHLLRHSLASSLLRQGASLQDIANVLRHQSVTTTQIYAKVDVAALQQIAQPWPEAPSC